LRRRHVPAIELTPSHWMSWRAALEAEAAVRLYGHGFRLAAVATGNDVPRADAVGDRHHRVGRAVEAEHGDGRIAVRAAAIQRAGHRSNGTKHVGSATRDGVRHHAAVAEAGGEDARLVDA
jgi:hypothetical protein